MTIPTETSKQTPNTEFPLDFHQLYPGADPPPLTEQKQFTDLLSTAVSAHVKVPRYAMHNPASPVQYFNHRYGCQRLGEDAKAMLDNMRKNNQNKRIQRPDDEKREEDRHNTELSLDGIPIVAIKEMIEMGLRRLHILQTNPLDGDAINKERNVSYIATTTL